jgi:transcriptional regulator with XRE-family HTH domain
MARKDRVLPLWGRNIKRLLVERGTTATAVADKLGMGIQQFSNITNDPDLNPTVGTLQRIADALGVPLADLFAHPEAAHAHARGSDQISPEFKAALTDTVRQTLVEVFTDVLGGLTTEGRTTGEQDADHGAQKTKADTLAAGDHRKAG